MSGSHWWGRGWIWPQREQSRTCPGEGGQGGEEWEEIRDRIV